MEYSSVCSHCYRELTDGASQYIELHELQSRSFFFKLRQGEDGEEPL
jgi:hypothetical protein